MKQKVKNIMDDMIVPYPGLEICKDKIQEAFHILRECYSGGGKVLVCGNGGSAADSEHIVGELMKGFLLKRKICSEDSEKIKASFPDDWNYLSDNLQGTLPAFSLVSQASFLLAYINDVSHDMAFAQQVYGYGCPGDVLIGLSTSGKSKNVVNAFKIARAFGLKTIGFTSKDGGVMKELCDVAIMVPATDTYKVQEYHLPVYHVLCAMLEAEFFEE